MMFGLGAGCMYLYDPEHGARRRAEMGERAMGLVQQLDHTICDAAVELRGTVSELPTQVSHMISGQGGEGGQGGASGAMHSLMSGDWKQAVNTLGSGEWTPATKVMAGLAGGYVLYSLSGRWSLTRPLLLLGAIGVAGRMYACLQEGGHGGEAGFGASNVGHQMAQGSGGLSNDSAGGPGHLILPEDFDRSQATGSQTGRADAGA